MSSNLPSVLLLSFTLMGAAPAAELRTWTDAQGKQIKASFQEAKDGKVSLMLETGAKVTVPLTVLSKTDQDWLASRKAAPAGDYDGPPAEATWPRTVSLQGLPEVKTVREDSTKKEFVYESEHYEFICDSPLSINLVREFSQVFEATWRVNCVLPLDFKPFPEDGRKKFQARIFTAKEDYMKAGGVQGSAGVYVGGEDRLMLPLDSLGVKMFGSKVTVDPSAKDYQTLIHEITHQMMNHWLIKLPQWYKEGAAEYVRLAKYDNGRFTFVQPGDRLKAELFVYFGGKFPMIPLERLMTLSNAEWNAQMSSLNYASSLALTYYFYHIDGDGKGTHIGEYIRDIEKISLESDPRPAAEEVASKHLLRGRSYEDLEKDVQKGLRRDGITVEFGN